MRDSPKTSVPALFVLLEVDEKVENLRLSRVEAFQQVDLLEVKMTGFKLFNRV